MKRLFGNLAKNFYQKEDALLEAISKGDLEKVEQLLQSPTIQVKTKRAFFENFARNFLNTVDHSTSSFMSA